MKAGDLCRVVAAGAAVLDVRTGVDMLVVLQHGDLVIVLSLNDWAAKVVCKAGVGIVAKNFLERL